MLTFYNQYLLLRNFTTGLRKAIFAGIRLAIVSTVGIATIAASINAGGLGILLFEGLRTMNIPKILWESVLSTGMAVLLNAVLKMVEEKM